MLCLTPLRRRGFFAALLVVIAAISFVACSPAPFDDVSSRQLPIINGKVSASGFLPAVGALVVRDFFGTYQAFCTATLISKRWALTAAHCLKSAQIPARTPTWMYFGNAVGPDAAKRVIAIKKSYPHPKYKEGTPPGMLADWYDIGLVEFVSDVPVVPMKMITPQEVGPALRLGDPMLIVGFGESNASNPQSAGVKHDGFSKLAMVGSSEIYIDDKTGSTTCHGDSGGPTFVDVSKTSTRDYRHVGVTSRGAEGCVLGSVETRTDVYLTWIHSLATGIPCGSGKSPACKPPVPKKKLGEACKAHAECASTLCAMVGDKGVCTQICDTRTPNCPSGFICEAVDDQGVKGVCLVGSTPPPPPPGKKKLGDPCQGHDECDSGLCASQGDKTFCTKSCTPGDGTCGGLECLDVGGGQHLCVDASSGGGGGGCALTPPARGKGDAFPGGLFSIVGLLLLGLAVRHRRG